MEKDVQTPKVIWNRVKEYQDIEYFTSPEGIAKIAINRPEVHNAFRPQTLFELREAFELAHEDPEVGVIILTGNGGRMAARKPTGRNACRPIQRRSTGRTPATSVRPFTRGPAAAEQLAAQLDAAARRNRDGDRLELDRPLDDRHVTDMERVKGPGVDSDRRVRCRHGAIVASDGNRTSVACRPPYRHARRVPHKGQITEALWGSRPGCRPETDDSHLHRMSTFPASLPRGATLRIVCPGRLS